MNDDIILELSQRADSFYIYDENKILKNIAALKQHFPSIKFLYSVKCNPNEAVMATIFKEGLGADVASIAEVKAAQQAGCDNVKIYYSAPGKTRADLESAIQQKAVIIADSLRELYRIEEIAAAKQQTLEIGIRINPNFGMGTERGMPSKFGIDEEQVFATIPAAIPALPHLKITGLHVHVKSQELAWENLASYYDHIIDLTKRFRATFGPIKFLNMGSGMGIPYASDDEELNLQDLADHLNPRLSELKDTEILIETGRFLTCNAGYYATKVVDRKESRGTTYVLLRSTLGGFVRPSLAQLVKKYAEEPEASEPLFTKAEAFQFQAIKAHAGDGACGCEEAPKWERVTLTGSLCTATDVIAENILMPILEEDDMIVISNAGSYGATLSPMRFSSLATAAEFVLSKDGKITGDLI